MADPKSQEEPSMEEILASIRRIISEDGDSEEDGESAAASEGGADAAETSAGSPAATDDEVLELTEVVDEAVEAKIESEDDADNVVALNQDEDADTAEVEAPPEEAAAEEEAAPEEIVSEEPAAEDKDALVSEGIEQSAAAALAQLASGTEDQTAGGFSITPGGRTIEEYVLEMLRPMLRDWLDQNLQGIVERLVQGEIDRIGRRTDSK